jgi:hypothetical protein
MKEKKKLLSLRLCYEVKTTIEKLTGIQLKRAKQASAF